MTYEEFLDGYNQAQDKDEYILSHIKMDEYIPFEKKVYYCERIVDITSTATINGTKMFKTDSANRYVLYCLQMISFYTDIDVHFEDGQALEIFNALDKEGLIDNIISKLPQSEATKMTTILQMKVDDYYSNYRDLPSYMDSKFEAIRLTLNSIIEIFTNNPEFAGIVKENTGIDLADLPLGDGNTEATE